MVTGVGYSLGDSGRDNDHITRADFPLSGLATMLAEVGRELEQGRGFLRLRGLPAARYDEDEPLPSVMSGEIRLPTAI